MRIDHVFTPAGAFTEEDAAKYLACSIQSLDELVEHGHVQRCRIGNTPVFRRLDLDVFLASSIEKDVSHE